MIVTIFWTVVALDAIAALLLWKLFERGTHGLLVALYLAVLLIIALVTLTFALLRSDSWRIAVFIALLVPSVPLVFYSVAAAVMNVVTERQFSGSAYFSGPAFDLAQALIRRDPDLIKQSIPAAGDLNRPHGQGMTLWQFAVMQAEDTDPSIDILRILIAGGADPKRDTSAGSLQHAANRGPHLTRFLLDAGSNPNLLDHEQRPLWWRTMQSAEDDAATEILIMMLDHGADLTVRAPDGRGPVAYAVANRYWYAACLLIERGAVWDSETVRKASIPQLLEWEILRRDEYPLPVPDKLRKVLATMKRQPAVIPASTARAPGDVRVPDLLHSASFDKLTETRAAVARLAQQPNWVRRVEAFFEESDGVQRNHVALVLSLKPNDLPEDLQERCWTVLREQVAWYDGFVTSSPKEPQGWLLKDTAVIAVGLASIPGPVRDRHRADFTGQRDRIEACRKANDPAAAHLADLKKVDWRD